MAPTRSRRPRNRFPLPTPLLAVLLVAVTTLGAGCGKQYLRADVRLNEVKGKPAERDVRRTANYLAIANNIKTVAIRAPDSCFSATAGQATGVARNAGTILTTECAVWLAELERALTVEGYRVISWDVLLRAERTGGGSIYDVAKRLGADLVFILNSLEAASLKGGADLALSFNYYKSDPYGARLGDFLLDENQMKTLGDYIKQKVRLREQHDAIRSLSVMLDTTAIMAGTGESVWYYRWGSTRLVGMKEGTTFLFRGRQVFWRPLLPLGVEFRRMEGSGIMSSQQVVVSSVSARGEDLYQQALFALVQSVARDFVLNFHVGAH